MLTTVPLVESWGHFPAAQRRLFALLRRHRPRGLLLLSGDVHYAEILQTRAGARGAGVPLEVTSSGMTHTCGELLSVCRWLLEWYPTHRWAPPGGGSGVYTGLNYGYLTIEWPDAGPVTARVHATVRNASGHTVLEVRRDVGAAPDAEVLPDPIGLHSQTLRDRCCAAAVLLAVGAGVRAWARRRRAGRKQKAR